MTPEQWLQYLCERMDARAPRLRRLRDRLEGNGPLPEGADGMREAYRAFQRRARAGFAPLLTNAVAERMVISGVRVGDGTGDDDTARKIMRRNRLGILAPDVHRDMLGLSAGYVSVVGTQGNARIVYERPEQVITEQDPLDPWNTLASLKVWRDKVRERDFAVLSLPTGQLYRWFRPHKRESGLIEAPIHVSGGWIPQSLTVDLAPWVTTVPFWNAGGVAEFEQHTDILDRIDYGILQRLVVMAMQAYRQRATEGDLPEHDEAGNVIDYAALLKPGPGALWNLPPGVKLWESQSTDPTPLLTAVKDDIRELCAVTSTPLSTLMPDSANQSAEGASAAREGLVFKTENRIERARASWSQVLAQALAIEAGVEELPDVDVDFRPAAQLSLSERADAATKAADLPWETRMTDIWGYDGDAVKRMQTQRSQDALVLGLAQAPAAPALPAAPTPAPAELPAAS